MLSAGSGLALQPVHQVDNGVKAPPCAAADAGARDGYSEMALAGAGPADQHGVALLGEKAAARQIVNQHLVDRRAGEVELVEILGQRKLGDRELVFNRARLLLGDLGTE